VLVARSAMEQRYEAVMAVLRDGEPVTEVAVRFGVSRQSVHEWIRRYEQGGISALADGSHRPATCRHQMPAEIEAEVIEDGATESADPGTGRLIERKVGHSGLL
jgi:transposase